MPKSIAYNTIVQYIGKGIGLVLSFFTTTLLLRALGVDGYGNYSIVYAVTGIFISVADLGFFWYTVKELSALNAEGQRARLRQLFASRLATLAVVTVAFLVLVAVLGFWHVYPVAVTVVLAWATLFVFASVINNFFSGLFQFNMRMDYPLVGDVLGRVAVLAVVAYGYFFERNFFILAGSPIVGILVTVVISGAFLRRKFTLPLRLEWNGSLKGVLKLVPYGLVTMLTLLYFKADTVILSLLKPASDVGIYSAPYRMIELSLLLPSMFVSALYPALTKAGNDPEKFNRLTSLAFQLLIFIGLPVVLLIEIFSPFIVGLIGGQEFLTASSVTIWGVAATSVTVLRILTVFVFISFLTNLIGPLLFSLNRNKMLAKMYVGILSVNILLNLLIVPHLSYVGAAATNILTESLVLIVGLRLVADRIRITLDWSLIGRWLVIGLVVLVFTLGLRAVTLLHDGLLLLVAAALYAALIWFSRSFNRGWKEFLQKESEDGPVINELS